LGGDVIQQNKKEKIKELRIRIDSEKDLDSDQRALLIRFLDRLGGCSPPGIGPAVLLVIGVVTMIIAIVGYFVAGDMRWFVMGLLGVMALFFLIYGGAAFWYDHSWTKETKELESALSKKRGGH
jgi:uncharacterized membrane protein